MNARENALMAYRHQQPLHIPNFFTDFDIWDAYGERYFGEGTGPDWFGVQWTHTPELNSQTLTPGFILLDDITEWREKVIFPDLNSYDWSTIAAEATSGWDRINRVSFCMLLNGPLERLMSLVGFENAMYAFYDEPETVHELLTAITDYKCHYLEILKKYFNFDIIAFHDDWGNNQNLFISEALWEEFIQPHIQRVIDKTHELNMIFEMHSCGYIFPLINTLVQMGIDALDPIQYSNDPAKVKSLYGHRILLNGGFNSQAVLEHPAATESEIRAEVQNTIDTLAPGGSFGTMCPIINRKVAAIVSDEIATYGKNYYKKQEEL